MIRKCNNLECGLILDYIGDNYSNCLYLYLNVIKYGCASEVTRTWIQSQDGHTTAVFLAYHTALHIYSKDDNLIVPEIVSLVDEINPTIVNAKARIIKKLEHELKKKGYYSEFGHIGEWIGNSDCTPDFEVMEANDDDIPTIARLLFEDEDIGASYIYEDLLKQMRERLNEGYARSFVIHKDGVVVAHVGTGAETEKVCTIAYTITSPNYRGQGFAGRLYKHVCGSLKKEGKRVFSVYYLNSARDFHHKVGFADICECGKLYLNVK